MLITNQFSLTVKNMKKIISFSILLILYGCAAMGPKVPPSEFQAYIEKAVPKGDGEIRIYSKGEWFPDGRGHTDSNIIHVNDNFRQGVLVITDEALLFMQWDSDSFYVIKRLPHSELIEASLSRFGLSTMVMVRKKDLSYDSFMLSSDGIFTSTEKSKQVIKILNGFI